MIHLQDDIAQLPGLVHTGFGKLGAHHQLGHLGDGYILDEAGFHQLAVAQHRVAVRDLEDLLQFVGDKDKGGTRVPQTADDAKEHLDLCVVQRGGGLIQNQQPGVGKQRLGDFQQLFFAGVQLRHKGGGADIQADLVQQLRCALDHARLVEHAKAAHQLLAQVDVLIHAQVVKQVELLVHKGDAGVF